MHTRIYKVILVPALLAILQSCASKDRGNPLKLKMTVNPADLVRRVAINPADSSLNRALTDAQKKAGSLQIADFIDTFVTTYREENPGVRIAPLFVPGSDVAGASIDNAAVVALIKQHANAALAQTYKILKLRLKEFTVDTLIANLDAKRGVIKAQLYTKSSFERVKGVVGVAGKLEIFEAYGNAEMLPLLINANDAMRSVLSARAKKDKVHAATRQDAEADTASINAYLSDEAKARHDEEGTEANPLFAVISPSLTPDQQSALDGPVVGYVYPKDTARVRALLSLSGGIFGRHTKFLYGKSGRDTTLTVLCLYALRVPDNGAAMITGSDLTRAVADFEQTTENPCVTMDMTADGARKWSEMTLRQKGSFIALVYDDEVASCPRVNEQITSGNTMISGGFTKERAWDLAVILSSGQMPVPVTVSEDRGGQ